MKDLKNLFQSIEVASKFDGEITACRLFVSKIVDAVMREPVVNGEVAIVFLLCKANHFRTCALTAPAKKHLLFFPINCFTGK
ncbi:hypothetical protein D3C71_1771740 [compost metagenome]